MVASRELATDAYTHTVFGICSAFILYRVFARRAWWVLATLGVGAVFECAGNAVRIYGHWHADVVDPYIAQQVILVLTPAFIAACHFATLGKLGQAYAHQLPRFIRKPQWITAFFVILDVASLGIQGAGSGLAGSTEASDTDADVDTVNNYGLIVVGGLALQLVGYLVFNVVFVLFSLRLHRAGLLDSGSRLRAFLIATWSASALILIRSTFRTVEMALGWIGPVATREWYYLVFDATLVAASIVLLTFYSPADHVPTGKVMEQAAEKYIDEEQA